MPYPRDFFAASPDRERPAENLLALRLRQGAALIRSGCFPRALEFRTISRFALWTGGWLAVVFWVQGCSTPDRSSADIRPATERATGKAETLEGRPIEPLAESRGDVTVLVFVRKDCPISNRYAPTLHKLYEEFSPRAVSFYLVYPNPSTTADEIRQHLDEYEYRMRAVRDPRHALVKVAGAHITPEAAVFDRAGELVYRGRIDDRYVAFGKARAEPTTHDLQAAIEAALTNGTVSKPVTEAVGCYISDLQ